jgi:hypothetical protein
VDLSLKQDQPPSDVVILHSACGLGNAAEPLLHRRIRTAGGIVGDI